MQRIATRSAHRVGRCFNTAGGCSAKPVQTLALGAMASALLVACGGGDAPAAAADAGRASALAAASPSGSSYRVAVSERTTMTRIDSCACARPAVPSTCGFLLEQNSVAAQQALLAEAAGLTDRRRCASAPAVRAAVKEHGQRVRSAQSGMAAQLGMLGAKELGRVRNAHNALAVRVDAAELKADRGAAGRGQGAAGADLPLGPGRDGALCRRRGRAGRWHRRQRRARRGHRLRDRLHASQPGR